MNKRNEKSVGATSSRPHFEEIAKYNKGITLIALIITIIVMLILVGVTVNVALNGGLFDTAKQAASGMNMAQIQERAEMVKYMLEADIESGKTIVGVKSEYINRLKTEFGITDNEILGNKLIVGDGKYDIVFKNTDLDIEVLEHSERVDTSSIMSLILEDTNIEVDNKVYGINLSINLKKNIEKDKYVTKNIEEDNKKIVTFEEQKTFALDLMSQEVTQFKGIDTTIESTDQYFEESFNYEATQLGLSTNENLDKWIVDENLPTIIETIMGLEKGTAPTLTNRSDLYNFFMGNTDFTVEATERDLIVFIYEINQPDYGLEYDNCMSNLRLYLYKSDNGNPIRIMYPDTEKSSNIIINKNGEYKFILKNSSGQEIASEIIQVNNIETINPYVLTAEEADGIWSRELGEPSTIRGYYGEETNIILPLYIGEQKMTKIASISYWSYVENIEIPEGYENINGYFYQSSHIIKITIPNSMKTIHEKAFIECTNLTNIYVEAGSTLTIPETKPWGAPNATVTVLPAE